MVNKTVSSERGRTWGNFGGTTLMVKATKQLAKEECSFVRKKFPPTAFSAALLSLLLLWRSWCVC